MTRRFPFVWISLLFLLSCVEADPVPDMVEGLKPVYKNIDGSEIEAQEPRPFDNLGKIVFVDPYLFINEQLNGIHVIDNTDPSNPETIAFWNIPGNLEFTVSGNLLYADNSQDIYTIDISDIHDIKLLSTVENAYATPPELQFYPADYNGSFECVDLSNGTVVGWESDLLISPKCWR